MALFHVVIIGHLDLIRKPKELPDTIRQLFAHEVDNPQELIGRVHTHLKEITEVRGMGCRIEPENVEVGRRKKSIFVPIEMITYIETEIKLATGEMPQEDPDAPGEFVDRQGKRVGKQ